MTSPSVTLSTTTAGATNVTYDVRFSTSPTGALAPYYSTITLAAPTGTVFSSNDTYTIDDLTTATQCGLYNVVTSNSGATVTLSDYGGCGTIGGGDTVLVTASGVANPTVASSDDTVTVSTSSDTVSGQSNSYAIGGGAQPVASPLVTLSTTAAGATNVSYTTSFTTSSTGALASDSGTISLAAPSGTVFGLSSTYSIEDLTTSTYCGYYDAVTSNSAATVTLTVGCGIGAGDTVLVTASAVSNPTTPSTGDTVAVTTSSDTTPADTNPYAITAAKAVAAPSVALSTTAAGATNVTYDVRFTTSSTGALAPVYSTITLAAPAGTSFTSDSSYGIDDVTTGEQCDYYNAVTSNGGATVTFDDDGGCGGIASGSVVLVTATGRLQPGDHVDERRTDRHDLLGHGLGPDQHVRHHGGAGGELPTVTLSTKAAGATNVTYSTSFTTSPTGALSSYYSTITLAAPAGTLFSSSDTYTVEDISRGTLCGTYSSPVTGNGGATVTVSVGGSCGTIAGGDTVLVTVSGVSNPTATSTGDVIAVTTSSDTLSAQTGTYAITAAQAVTSAQVTLSTSAAGATNVTYTTSFTTSSTGALAPYYSTITLAAPAGTVFTSDSSYTVEDLTTGSQCGYYSPVTSNGGATVTFSDEGGCGTIAGRRHRPGLGQRGLQPDGHVDERRPDHHDLLGHRLGPDQHVRHHGGAGGELAHRPPSRRRPPERPTSPTTSASPPPRQERWRRTTRPSPWPHRPARCSAPATPTRSKTSRRGRSAAPTTARSRATAGPRSR